MTSCLDYKNSILHWDSTNLEKVADTFGTPVFVFCSRVLQQSVEKFYAPFRSENIPIVNYFSVKTNPISRFLQALLSMGMGAEIISPFELWLCKKLGFTGDKIIVTGVRYEENYCLEIVTTSPRMWILESLNQVEYLQKLSKKFNQPINIGLRICPELRTSRFNMFLSSGSSRAPFGFRYNSDEFERALKIVSLNPLFSFVGYHFHLGSAITKNTPYQKALSCLENIVVEKANQGFVPRTINIGGGFGLKGVPVLGPVGLLRSKFHQKSMSSEKKDTLLPDIARVLRLFAERLNKNGIEIKSFFSEAGRYISGPSQLIVLSVQEIIRRNTLIYAICDGGAMSLSPMLFFESHAVLPLICQNRPHENYSIIGNLPSQLDVVLRSALLPQLQCGDKIAVLDTGAYFYSFSNNFAGPRPPVVIVKEGQFTLVQKREDFEHLVQREIQKED